MTWLVETRVVARVALLGARALLILAARCPDARVRIPARAALGVVDKLCGSFSNMPPLVPPDL